MVMRTRFVPIATQGTVLVLLCMLGCTGAGRVKSDALGEIDVVFAPDMVAAIDSVDLTPTDITLEPPVMGPCGITCDSPWTGSWWETETPLDIAVSGNHAYVAMGAAGLVIYKIGESGEYLRVGSLDTPGYTVSVQVVGDQATLMDAHEGVQVVDISVPDEPTLLGGVHHCEMGIKWSPLSIAKAAVSDSITAYSAWDGIRFVHLSDPGDPVLRGGLELTDLITELVSDESGFYAITGAKDLIHIAIADALTTPVAQDLSASWEADYLTHSSLNVVAVDSGVAVVNGPNGGLGIANLNGAEGVPIFQELLYLEPYTLESLDIYAVAMKNGRVAMVNWGFALPDEWPPREGVCMVDLSNPAKPAIEDCVEHHVGWESAVDIDGDGRVHVATTDGLYHVDFSGDAPGEVLSHLPVTGEIIDVTLFKDTLFATTANGLLLSMPATATDSLGNPSKFLLPEGCRYGPRMAKVGDYLAVSCGYGGAYLYAVSGTTPALLYAVDYLEYVGDIAGAPGLLAVAVDDHLSLLEIAEDGKVLAEHQYPVSNLSKVDMESMHLFDKMLMVHSPGPPLNDNWGSDWTLLDVSDPGNPLLVSGDFVASYSHSAISLPYLAIVEANSWGPATIAFYHYEGGDEPELLGEFLVDGEIHDMALVGSNVVMVLEELENGGVTSVAVADLATTTNWVEPTFYCPPAAAAFEALHFYYGERYSLDIGPGTIAFSSGKGGIGVLNF